MMASTSTSRLVHVVGLNPPKRYIGSMKKNSATDNGEYAAFFGIPYAKKPEGEKRFQAPESLDSSKQNTQISDHLAVVFKDKCSIQFHKAGRVKGSSDCLYLNIYLPEDPKKINKPLPVLVYIHGGGFSKSSNDPSCVSPDFIIQEKVVFITINYRLGLHGFFNAHTKECPGNAGLKDQVKALEWIRDNIICFKGDPQNVTLSGQSAGATCVHLHLISPMSKGLFHKAIIQSGGIFFPWGYRGHRRTQKKLFMNDLEFVNLLDSYKGKKDYELYIRAEVLSFHDRRKRRQLLLSPYYGPSVESFSAGAFIPNDIEEMMKDVNHNIPVMAGITKGEGIHIFNILSSQPREIAENWSKKFSQLLTTCFRWSPDTAERCADEIRERFFRVDDFDKLLEKEKIQLFAKFIHDIFCRRFYDGFRFGPEKKIHKNLYVYQFEYYGKLSIAQLIPKLADFNDATHGDDTRYLYCPHAYRRQLVGECTEHDMLVTQSMCKMWADFCRNGIPRSDWTRHTEEKPCYLRIDKDPGLEQKSLGAERSWDWLNKFVEEQGVEKSLPPTPEG